jgi:TonB family protein
VDAVANFDVARRDSQRRGTGRTGCGVGTSCSVRDNVNADSVTPKINDMKIDIATACAIPTYPEAALRYGMQGDTMLKLMIDESGKIKAFQLVRSSGWKMLDLTVMNAIIGCQILPEGRWVPSETYTAYRWKFDQGYTSPAVLEADLQVLRQIAYRR